MNWYEAATREPLLDGEPVTIKGQLFIVPSLGIRASREIARMQDRLEKSEYGEHERAIVAQIGFVGIALRRNYPGLSDEMVEERLDPSDLLEVIAAVRKANGVDPNAKAPESGANGTTSPAIT